MYDIKEVSQRYCDGLLAEDEYARILVLWLAEEINAGRNHGVFLANVADMLATSAE